jgi:hypothetical protein
MAKIVIDEIDRVVGRIEVTPEQAERRKTEEAKIAARRSFRRIGRNR